MQEGDYFVCKDKASGYFCSVCGYRLKEINGGQKCSGERKPGEPKSKVRDIPDQVGGYLVVHFKENPDWVWKLKAVVRQRQENRNVFDVRVFDEYEAAKKDIKIIDNSSLEEHPELILYEGWYSREPPQVQMEKRARA